MNINFQKKIISQINIRDRRVSKCGPMLSVWRCTRDICLASHPAWSPGPLSVCLCRRRQWSFSQAFGHWLGEIFTFSYIFFCRIQTKTQEEEATTTYMHSIAYYYNYFNVHTTERLPPPTRRFFMPQDYLQFLLSTRIIMQSLLLLILLTTLYYCHFWKKKHFWRVTNVVFLLFWKTKLVFV